MRIALLAVITASQLATSSQASDFSQIGEPAFARALLISPQRQQEALCVAVAHYQGRADNTLGAADVQHMADALAARLTEEIGDSKNARELVETRFGWFDATDQDSAEDRKLKGGVAAEIAARCKPLLDAYRSGGVAAFEAKLVPSEGLIPLLSLPRCIALTEYVAARDPNPMFDKEGLVELHQLAREGRSEADIRQLEEAIAAERVLLAEAKPDLEQLGARPIACMATFRLRAEEVGRTSF